MAAHLGEADEEKINNMSYVWFTAVLSAIGKKISFESISNLYGNSFAKDAGKVIQQSYPLAPNGGKKQSGGIMDLAGQIKIIDKNKDSSDSIKTAEKTLGDLSWVSGMFD